jgi:hypothetical protein
MTIRGLIEAANAVAEQDDANEYPGRYAELRRRIAKLRAILRALEADQRKNEG